MTELMIRVYADIVGDLFHFGQVELLRQARAPGDYLSAGVSADEVVGPNTRRPVLTMEERVAGVAGCLYVDEVLPDAPWRIDRPRIDQHNNQLVAHGDDYSHEQLEDIYKIPLELGIVRTVPYTHGISTSEITRRILERIH